MQLIENLNKEELITLASLVTFGTAITVQQDNKLKISTQLKIEEVIEELKEAEILSKYLPEMASEDEIRAAVKAEIAEMGEVSIKQMGAIIGKMKAKFGNSADGAVLARIVKEELN